MTALWLLLTGAASAVAALIAGTLGVVTARSLPRRPRTIDSGWRGAARELGLTAEESVEMVGTIRGLGVQVRIRPDSERRCEVAVSSVPTDLCVGPSAGSTEPLEPLGDPRWDAHARVRVIEPCALARLTHEVRELAVPLLARGRLRIEDGFVMVLAPPGELDRPTVIRTIHEAVVLAEALRRTIGSLPRQLAASFHHDPVPGVQVRCLELLTRHAGGDLAREASIAALSHPHPRIRLLGARHLHRWDLLVGVAWDPRSPPELRQEAVDLLIWARQGLSPEILGPVLAEGGPPLWEQAARCASAYRTQEAVPALAGLVGTVIRPERWASCTAGERAATAAVVEALGALGPGQVCAEDALLELAAFPDARLRLAALRGLRAVATRAALSPLRQYTRAPQSRLIRRVAREAMQAASTRSGPRARGALSMADTGGQGRLALPRGPGRLSLVTEE